MLLCLLSVFLSLLRMRTYVRYPKSLFHLRCSFSKVIVHLRCRKAASANVLCSSGPRIFGFLLGVTPFSVVGIAHFLRRKARARRMPAHWLNRYGRFTHRALYRLLGMGCLPRKDAQGFDGLPLR